MYTTNKELTKNHINQYMHIYLFSIKGKMSPSISIYIYSPHVDWGKTNLLAWRAPVVVPNLRAFEKHETISGAVKSQACNLTACDRR